MSTYRFTLRTNTGTQVFGADKVKNWDSVKIGITRNETYRGLLKKFTGTFEFTKNIRASLISLYDKYGSEAEIYMKVEVGNRNKDRSSFRQFGTELKADMSTFDVSELTVGIQFIASGFEEKLFNRDSNEVEYATNTSIDGDSIPVFANETRKIELHSRELLLKSSLNIGLDAFPEVEFPTGTLLRFYGLALPLNIGYRSDDDFKDSFFAIKEADFPPEPESFFLLQASEDKQITIDYSLNSSITFRTSANGQIYSSILYVVHVDSDYNQKIVHNLGTYAPSGDPNVGVNGTVTIPINYSGQIIHDIAKGDSLQLLVYLKIGEGSYVNTKLRIRGINFQNNVLYAESKSVKPATTADCILPHELFSRICSILTGAQMPFYSEIFGRTDLGYAQDGAWAYLVALNGLMIRGFPFSGTDSETTYAKFSASLKDAFKAYNSILNIGATIEQTPDGNVRFRIDPYDSLFGNKVVLKLGDFIVGASRTPDKDMLFSELLVGYKEQEYEELNGIGTFNGEFNFAPPIKSVIKKMDIICPWRTDDYGIEQDRRKQYIDFPTEDTRSDKDIFLIDAKPNGNTLVAVKIEDYDSVTGILSPETAYNVRLSPGQNIRRWGSYIRASMPFGGIIKYTSGAKNTNLVTVKNGVTIAENADIDVESLAQNFMLPEKFVIDEVPLTLEQWKTIEESPNGLVQLESKGVHLYGYIDDVEYDIAKKKASITLKRALR